MRNLLHDPIFIDYILGILQGSMFFLLPSLLVVALYKIDITREILDGIFKGLEND